MLVIALLGAACGTPNPPGLYLGFRSELRRCIEERFPGVPAECMSAVIASELKAHRSSLTGANELVYAARSCEALIFAVAGPVRNSSDSVPPQEPTYSYTRLCLKVGLLYRPEPSSSQRVEVPAHAADLDEVFPCGDDGDGGLTLCASPSFPEGEWITAAMALDGDLPLADPSRIHQFGFVFDSDGDRGNNYRASPQYPNDFFDDTDRWYVAAYTPQQGWSIQVSDAAGGTIRPASSAARIVIDGPIMRLVVPAAELPQRCPSYRMTTFTHTGDYGQNPPHDWSGDVEPAVGEPLEDTCVELPPLDP